MFLYIVAPIFILVLLACVFGGVIAVCAFMANRDAAPADAPKAEAEEAAEATAE